MGSLQIAYPQLIQNGIGPSVLDVNTGNGSYDFMTALIRQSKYLVPMRKRPTRNTWDSGLIAHITTPWGKRGLGAE